MRKPDPADGSFPWEETARSGSGLPAPVDTERNSHLSTEGPPGVETPAPLPAGGPERSNEERGRSIVRNTVIVTLFSALGRAFGIGRELVMNPVLGTRAGADIYRFAVDRIAVDLYTKVEKLLQPTYLPLFVGRKVVAGEEAAWRFTCVTGTIQLLLLGVLAAFGSLWSHAVVDWFFPDAFMIDPVKVASAVNMLRLALVTLVIYSMSNLTELTLQAYEEFTIPALAESLRKIAMLGTLLAAMAVLTHLNEYQAVSALVYGLLLGAVARLVCHLPALGRRLLHFRPSLDVSNPDVRKAGRLMVWPIGGMLLALARNVVEMKTALRIGEGMLAGLSAARKFIDLPWQILGVAVSQVIYPFISELGAKEKRSDLADALVSMCRVLAFVFVPFTILLFATAEQLVSVLYERRLFTGASVDLTMTALVCYIPGLVFFAIEDPMLKWFYALSDTRTPMLLGVLSDATYFAVMFIGLRVLHAQLQALALAMVLSKALKVLTCFVILRYKLGGLPWKRIYPFLGKLTAASAVMVVALVLAGRACAPLADGGLVHKATFVAVMSVSGLVPFAAMSLLLRIEEGGLVVQTVAGKVLRKLGRK